MPKIPILSVVAYSGTGKTTLLERLIPALKAQISACRDEARRP